VFIEQINDDDDDDDGFSVPLPWVGFPCYANWATSSYST